MRITAIYYTGPVRILLFVLLLTYGLSACHSKKTNRLAVAASPYLQQHADNPVDWQEWGDAALQQAEKEHKPLLISIGYAACHWCHVMEEETFMDTAVASFMNGHFVCIKVDREERPDIDNLYSGACQLLTGNAGWPLNAFALPDGKAFFAGTYYSKASWLGLLRQIISAYKNQPGKVKLQAAAVADGLARRDLSLLADSTAPAVSSRLFLPMFDSITQQLDMRNGGLSGTPKFPSPYTLEFLMQYFYVTRQTKALNFVNNSLLQMATGGIYDQAGGGFARYAVDSSWRVPHFEKMLYDNSQLLSVYSHAYQLTGQPFYKTILQETATFLQRELKAPSGGFYSSVNADSPEGEGVFYTWTAEEFKQAIQPAGGRIADYYNITAAGNWTNHRNILFATETPAEFAHKKNIDSAAFQQQLQLAKKQLLTVRSSRPNPTVDKKVLSAWNALALKGYLDAYAATGEKLYLDVALDIAAFLEKHLMGKQGEFWRAFTDGKAGIPAFLEDYAFVCDAFIQLYQISFDLHWLTLARQLADQAISKFYDTSTAMFLPAVTTGKQSYRGQMQLADQSIPSPNAVMGRALYQLGILLQQAQYSNIAKGMVARMSGQLSTRNAVFYPSWCSLGLLTAYGSNEVVIIGENAQAENITLRSNYLPHAIFMGSAGVENLPLLEGKHLPARTMIYVCTNKTCRKPVSSAAEALVQLTAFNHP